VNRAIAWFAENHVAANLLMLMLIMGGLASLPTIQQKTFPDIDVEMIDVEVEYLGATPEEVEQSVCIRIEEEIHGITGIERINSTASEGECRVRAELISGYPVDRALSEIKNKVDGIDTFPQETEKPIVSHVTIKRQALKIALSGRASEHALKMHGQRIRDEIAGLPDVTQVDLINARDYEISIEVPESSLRRHGLTFDDVVAAVRRGSLDRPGGAIKTRAGEVLLRTKGQAYVGRDFEEIVVMTRPDGTRLLLREVAEVVDGFEDEDRYATFDAEPAVLIQVSRVGNQRVLDLVQTVRTYLEDASRHLPDGIKLTVWEDDAQALRERVDTLLGAGVFGFALVFALLAAFLRLRLAFWVAIGVPISFLGALFLFPFFDVSINVLSLFGFIVALGILVDDAIVVGENVHRHQEQAEEPLQASIRGAQEVSVPVIFGVLTSMVAFLPFSLIESQLVLPAHLAHMRIEVREASSAGEPASQLSARWKRLQRTLSGSLERAAQRFYRPALDRVLEWRYASMAGAVAMLMVAGSLAVAGHMRFSFFPAIDSDYISARISLAQGTPVETTMAAVSELESAARRLQAALDEQYGGGDASLIRHVFVSLGEQPTSGGGTGARPEGMRATGSHVGEVRIALQPGDARPRTAREIAQMWRDEVPAIPGVEELVLQSALFSAGDPISIELRSDSEELIEASESLKARLAEYPGVFDIADSFRDGKDEIKLSILPAAQALGVTLDDLARQVRQAFYGEEVQRVQRGRDDVRVMVRYPESQRRSLDDLDELRIRTPDGGEVPFYAVARAERGRGFATIRRADRQRVIGVTADLDPTRANANEILADLRAGFLPELLAAHPGLGYGLEGEQRQQREMLGSLVRNFSLALLGIYALLAIPLRSYLQPLIIMAVIPFGFVGAVVGHLVRGLTLNMLSILGVVALAGMVVNSSLVLVHYINQRRSEGASIDQAVRDAGLARFRPIVLTAITTFAGLAPLLSETSVSAQFLLPMAASVAFGVVFASAISLLLVPASYLVLDDIQKLFGRSLSEQARPTGPNEAAEAARVRVVGE
jgi:multidrug efflux pump subunit AcrB